MRNLTQAALTAKAIKNELKGLYSNVTFKITSKNYAGGDSVRISWTDGPEEKEIESLVKRYQYGNFDASTDYYDINNSIDGLPQVKYVFTSKSYSYEKALEYCSKIKNKYGIEIEIEKLENSYENYKILNNSWLDNFRCYKSEFLYKVFCGYFSI